MSATSTVARCVAVAGLVMSAGCGDDGAGNATSAGTATTDATGGSGGSAGSAGSSGGVPTCTPGSDDMVCVAAGPFTMGCDADADTLCSGPEFPSHAVTLGQFDIDRNEVTVAQYRACVDAGACDEPLGSTEPDAACNYDAAGREDHPVNCVIWTQAEDYCAFVGKMLPTEAQWEKAARGPDLRLFPWGDAAVDCTLAHYKNGEADTDAGCGTQSTAVVGQRVAGASPYGALDMSGNVEEWVIDWFDGQYYAESPPADPPGPEFGTHRGVRGGTFRQGDMTTLRTGWRWGIVPGTTHDGLGFRCAR